MSGLLTTAPERRAAPWPGAFTLVELLVVIAIIAVLAALTLPALALGKEKAKTAKVHGELAAVGLALEMYSQDWENALPPVRVNCNSDLSTHWCQFPVELVDEGYLGRGNKPGMAANMEDVFNPGHTYKYAAPGPQYLNGGLAGCYRLWEPDDVPACASTNGLYYTNSRTAPVRWVIWSLGPKPDGAMAQDELAPLARRSWHRRSGQGGVIVRFQTHNGTQYKSP